MLIIFTFWFGTQNQLLANNNLICNGLEEDEDGSTVTTSIPPLKQTVWTLVELEHEIDKKKCVSSKSDAASMKEEDSTDYDMVTKCDYMRLAGEDIVSMNAILA